MIRAVDKTKKSNIKCEHCKYFSSDKTTCLLLNERKYYWNRCKKFEWYQGEV